jgi:hypothetical protein
MARAHLVLRVDVDHGKPIPRDVHAGSPQNRVLGTERG